MCDLLCFLHKGWKQLFIFLHFYKCKQNCLCTRFSMTGSSVSSELSLSFVRFLYSEKRLVLMIRMIFSCIVGVCIDDEAHIHVVEFQICAWILVIFVWMLFVELLLCFFGICGIASYFLKLSNLCSLLTGWTSWLEIVSSKMLSLARVLKRNWTLCWGTIAPKYRVQLPQHLQFVCGAFKSLFMSPPT